MKFAFFLAGLVAVNALYVKRHTDNIYAQYAKIYQFEESTSLNECETWAHENNSIPIHNLFGSNARNTTCLDVDWDSTTLGTSFSLDVTDFPNHPLITETNTLKHSSFQRDQAFEIFMHNVDILPDATMVLAFDTAEAKTADNFIGKISVDTTTGAITGVSVVNAGKTVKADKSVKVKWWGLTGAMNGMQMNDVTIGKDAEFELVLSDIQPDGTGTITSVTVVKGGKNYQATQDTFSPETFTVGKWVPTQTVVDKKIDSHCEWTDDLGVKTTFSKENHPSLEEDDCSLEAATRSEYCRCYYFGYKIKKIRRTFSLETGSCDDIVATFENRFNGKFTAYAYTCMGKDCYGLFLDEPMLPEGVTKETHLPLGQSVLYRLEHKWKHDERNVRKNVTVKVTPQEANSKWNCDETLVNLPDVWAKYSCDKAKQDQELNPVEYLNKRARGVKQVPFVTGLLTNPKLTVDTANLPTYQFQKGANKVNLDGSGCTIQRRPIAQQGVLREVRVVYGGEGCTEKPMLRIQGDSMSKWMNVSLTLSDGKITKAELPVEDIRDSHESGGCTNSVKDNDETAVDEGGSCDFFKAQGTFNYELWDFTTIESLEMQKPGINANVEKDSNDKYKTSITFDTTYPTDAIVTDHANIELSYTNDRFVRLELKDSGTGVYWQKIADLVDPDKIFKVTQTTNSAEYKGRKGPAFKVIPMTTRNCKIPPQFEFIIEDGTKTSMQDAKCKFVWEKVPCPDGLNQNYTLKDVVITEHGTGYQSGSVTTDDVTTTYPHISLPATLKTDNWFEQKLTVTIGESERAAISFKNKDGIMSATVDNGGKGYNPVVDVNYDDEYGLKIGMPVMTDFGALSRDELHNGKNMVRDLVVLEGGSGYKEYQQVCCFKPETADAEAEIVAFLPNGGAQIGTITLTDGVVTAATLAPESHMYCKKKFNQEPHFSVCGRKLEKIQFKESEYDCGERGLYDDGSSSAPKILFDVDDTMCGDDCTRPELEAVLNSDGHVSSFTVKDGGWFKDVQTHKNGHWFEVDNILYDWGGDLEEECDQDPAVDGCVKSPRLHQSSVTNKYILTWEASGVGATLELDHALHTLNAVRGKKYTTPGGSENVAGGAYQKKHTNLAIGNGAVTGLILGRSAYHTFTAESFPLKFKLWSRWSTKFEFQHLQVEDRNSDGTLKDVTLKFPTNVDHKEFKTKWTQDLKADKYTAQHTDNKLNEHLPLGFPVTIYDVDGKDLNGFDNTAFGNSEGKADSNSNLFGRWKPFGALTGPLVVDTLGSSGVYINDNTGYNTYININSGDQTSQENAAIAQGKLLNIDENSTQTWLYETLQAHSLKVKLDSPKNSGSFYYEDGAKSKTNPDPDRIPFESNADLFKVFTSFKVSFEVEDILDITDSYVNVTVTKDAGLSERYRVCPKHNLYESIHFETEVYEGNGKFYADEQFRRQWLRQVKVYYLPSRDLVTANKKHYLGRLDGAEYRFPNNLYNGYKYALPDTGITPEARFMDGCVDVMLEWDDTMCKTSSEFKANQDTTLEVRLSAKVTYFGGECIIDDDCIDRTNGGGATKASFAVRESVNSDIDRFTYCYVGSDSHAPTCRECRYDTDCDGGQFCFDSSKIITALTSGKYYTSEMQAWAHKMINKHGTCQKKEGLGKSCGTSQKTDMSPGDDVPSFLTNYNDAYKGKYTKNGDTSYCGAELRDYDGHVLEKQWEGFCESHVCVECTDHVHAPAQNGAGQNWQALSGKKCIAGQLVNSRLTGITNKNDYWDQAQKLSNDNEAATKVAEAKLTMLTDIMGVTLMFSILTAFSAFLTTMLLMGRCGSCKTQSTSKVAPE